MAEVIEMPKLSDTMTEGTLVKWRKKEGDKVESGEIIAEVETDKATMDLECFETGILIKILAKEGDSVPVNSPIAYVGEAGEKVDDAPKKAAPAKEAAKSEDKGQGKEKKEDAKGLEGGVPPEEKEAAAKVEAPKVHEGRVKASPLAKKIAEDKGISIEGLTGSGPGGRIVRQDVLAAAVQGGGAGWGVMPTGPIAKDERIPLTNMRKTIAKRLLESKTQIPHFYVEMEIDAQPIVTLREQLNARFEKLPKPFKLSVNDFVLKAATQALRKVPVCNASFEGDAIRQNGKVHMAFAVALPEGLITPVIKDADSKNLKEIGEEAKALGAKAKEGKLKPEDYTGGTFTVSNLGMMGVDRFSAIINPPQSTILAVGGVINKAVVDGNGSIVAGKRMSLVVSCDHRVVDGLTAAQYLNELKALLEAPALLLI